MSIAGASEEAIAFEIVKYLITISLHLKRQGLANTYISWY